MAATEGIGGRVFVGGDIRRAEARTKLMMYEGEIGTSGSPENMPQAKERAWTVGKSTSTDFGVALTPERDGDRVDEIAECERECGEIPFKVDQLSKELALQGARQFNRTRRTRRLWRRASQQPSAPDMREACLPFGYFAGLSNN